MSTFNIRCGECGRALHVVHHQDATIMAAPCPAHPRAEWWVIGVLPGVKITKAVV